MQGEAFLVDGLDSPGNLVEGRAMGGVVLPAVLDQSQCMLRNVGRDLGPLGLFPGQVRHLFEDTLKVLAVIWLLTAVDLPQEHPEGVGVCLDGVPPSFQQLWGHPEGRTDPLHGRGPS
eukprot:676444-Hanusia_phi.AAC.1